ncbi:hypothetical protein DUI87_33493 [Hirundo rustica rustica]|uniref:MORN repeat-containing protein 3 n=1 Tax=Hirundo rustica rustica TaxID=333673 RepID=A0A3M0J6A5_HIRRU|nr:hypothetical protein DUI87_33493 [Hirundo rustica rustica]
MFRLGFGGCCSVWECPLRENSLDSRGTLKWRDGRNHVGDFREGLEHGFGIRLVPRRSEDRYDCYKCHWYRGKMRGYGICEYGNDLVYKGYFEDDVRQGFGILENFSAQHPFKYTGHWEKDKKNGYGIWEDKERGERYIGMWLDDHRHGEGIVVTQSGLCYQRTFHADKMVGAGLDGILGKNSWLGWAGMEFPEKRWLLLDPWKCPRPGKNFLGRWICPGGNPELLQRPRHVSMEWILGMDPGNGIIGNGSWEQIIGNGSWEWIIGNGSWEQIIGIGSWERIIGNGSWEQIIGNGSWEWDQWEWILGMDN